MEKHKHVYTKTSSLHLLWVAVFICSPFVHASENQQVERANSGSGAVAEARSGAVSESKSQDAVRSGISSQQKEIFQRMLQQLKEELDLKQQKAQSAFRTNVELAVHAIQNDIQQSYERYCIRNNIDVRKRAPVIDWLQRIRQEMYGLSNVDPEIGITAFAVYMQLLQEFMANSFSPEVVRQGITPDLVQWVKGEIVAGVDAELAAQKIPSRVPAGYDPELARLYEEIILYKRRLIQYDLIPQAQSAKIGHIQEQSQTAGLSFTNRLALSLESGYTSLTDKLPILKPAIPLMIGATLCTKLTGMNPLTAVAGAFQADMLEAVVRSSMNKVAVHAFDNHIENPIKRMWRGGARYLSHYWKKAKGEVVVTDAMGIAQYDPEPFNAKTDLIGIRQAFEQIITPIKLALENMGKSAVGLKGQQKAFLIQGPSGVGKSWLARIVSRSLRTLFPGQNVEFWPLSTVHGKLVFKDVLDKAIEESRKQKKVIVLFIDELHLVLNDAGQRKGDDLNEANLGFMLKAIDDLNKGEDLVMVVAASNAPGRLPADLRRFGRFQIVQLEKPNLQERKDLFAIELQKIGYTNFSEEHLDSYARATKGQTPALINRIVSQLSSLRVAIKPDLIQSVIEDTALRIVPGSEGQMPEGQRSRLATYFAAQALTYMKLFGKNPLCTTIRQVMPSPVLRSENYVSSNRIEQNTHWDMPLQQGKLFTYEYEDDAQKTTDDMQNWIKVYLAGKAGEKLSHGTHSMALSKDDVHRAEKLAFELALDGRSFDQLPDSVQRDIRLKQHEIIEQSSRSVAQLLQSNSKAFNALQADLQSQGIVRESAFDKYLKL